MMSHDANVCRRSRFLDADDAPVRGIRVRLGPE